MNIFHLLFTMEHFLATCALNFQLARERRELQDNALTAAASVVMALDQLIAEMGLDLQAMAKNSPPRHPYVYATITMSEGEEDPDQVAVHLEFMREQLAS